MQYWLFNTDESEAIGVGKHSVMLKHQVVAAHGWCKGKGAEWTLNQPLPGDAVFFYRAGHGFVACGEATNHYAKKTSKIFGAKREFMRPITNLRILDEDEIITAAEVKAATGQATSYRHIVSLIHGQKYVNFLVKRFQQIKAVPCIWPKTTRARWGGFQPDPDKRKEVEEAAIEIVTEIYLNRDWHVESVEQDKVGYDLHCIKGSRVNCVEVKGVSGNAEDFILTANELSKAKSDEDFVLIVVTNALLEPIAKKHSAKQLLAKFEMTPISYRVKPKT